VQTQKVYHRYISGIFLFPQKVYDWDIPGIYLVYTFGYIYKVYPRYIPGIYLRSGYTWDIPGIYHKYMISGDSRCTFDFVYKFCHALKLLSIVYKCTDASPKHSTLYFGAKSDKKICADHEYLQPLIIMIHTRTYSYILVYTCTYSYILSYNTVYFESGWIRLAMTYCRCCTLVPCIAHSILPLCGLFDGQASQAGSLNPCSC
jgi:hypothetical protein